MWHKALFQGLEFTCWICPQDIVDYVWKEGKLEEGQVWGQIDCDAPFRPVTLI